MPKKEVPTTTRQSIINAQPRIHQRAPEIQPYGTVSHALPLELEEPVRLEMTEQLNLLLADTMTLRDLYKKSHWQVAGPTFYQLHLLFDKHYEEQVEVVGCRRRGNHPHRTSAARSRRSAGPDLTSLGCASDHYRSLPAVVAPRFRAGGRWYQRYGGQRCSASERTAGVVLERASGRCSSRACRRARRAKSRIAFSALL
jgi:hypothetical protein